jgi:hypothetical protein
MESAHPGDLKVQVIYQEFSISKIYTGLKFLGPFSFKMGGFQAHSLVTEDALSRPALHILDHSDTLQTGITGANQLPVKSNP